jgi:hypothetical protein
MSKETHNNQTHQERCHEEWTDNMEKFKKDIRKLNRMKKRLKFMEQFIDWTAYILAGFILILLVTTFGYGIAYWVLYNDNWAWALLWCFASGVALAVYHKITKYMENRKKKTNEQRQDSTDNNEGV